jgi:hypothetical protein
LHPPAGCWKAWALRADAGTRIDLSEHVTLMVALGRDLADQLGPKASLLRYLGFQFRL